MPLAGVGRGGRVTVFLCVHSPCVDIHNAHWLTGIYCEEKSGWMLVVLQYRQYKAVLACLLSLFKSSAE